MIKTDRHYLGVWWSPSNPEEQYYGTLFIENDSAHLELLFLKEDIPEMKYQNFARSFIDSNNYTIHGCLGGLHPSPVTLFGISFGDYNKQQLNVISTGRFYINVKNIFFDKLISSTEEKAFSKIYVSLTHLNSWMYPEHPKFNHKGNEVFLSFIRPKPSLLYQHDDIQIFIDKDFTEENSFGNAFNYKLQYTPYLIIKSENKVSYSESLDIIEELKSFMMACMRCHPIVNEYNPYYGDEPLPHDCFLTIGKHEEKRFVVYKQYADFLNFQNSFERWLKYFKSNRANFYMFMDLLDNTKNIQEDRKCEQLVQIIEGLYKAQGKEYVSISEDNFNLFIKDKKKHERFVKNGYKTDMLFAKLVNIFMEGKTESFKPDFEKIYGKSSIDIIVRFIKAVKNFRDFFSHGAVKSKLDTLHPYYLNAILLKAVRIIMIQDIIGLNNINIELEDL